MIDLDDCLSIGGFNPLFDGRKPRRTVTELPAELRPRDFSEDTEVGGPGMEDTEYHLRLSALDGTYRDRIAAVASTPLLYVDPAIDPRRGAKPDKVARAMSDDVHEAIKRMVPIGADPDEQTHQATLRLLEKMGPVVPEGIQDFRVAM